MRQKEMVEIFFSKAFEEMWNEKILDDKLFAVPTERIHSYLMDVISIPYSEYLYFLIDYKLPKLSKGDITQCSSFKACEIEMCVNLIAEDNPGFEFIDIGMLFPQYCKTEKVGALRKYGENQIKTSRQLGLTYEYYGLWYLNCIGYAYPDLNDEQRLSLLARTLLRDPLYARIVRDLLNGDTDLSKYLTGFKESTIRRRGPGIIKILKIALREAEKEGISLGKCEFIKPIKISDRIPNTQSSLIKLFDKKVDKSFLSRGMTIPKKIVPTLESILKIYLEKGCSTDIIIEFNNLEYNGRFNHVNILANNTDCYQLFWKGYPSLADALKLFYIAPSSTTMVEVFVDPVIKRIIIKPKVDQLSLDL